MNINKFLFSTLLATSFSGGVFAAEQEKKQEEQPHRIPFKSKTEKIQKVRLNRTGDGLADTVALEWHHTVNSRFQAVVDSVFLPMAEGLTVNDDYKQHMVTILNLAATSALFPQENKDLLSALLQKFTAFLEPIIAAHNATVHENELTSKTTQETSTL